MGPIASSLHGRVRLARFQNLNYLFKDLKSGGWGGHFPEAAGDREPGRTWKQKDSAAPCSEQPLSFRYPRKVEQEENFLFPSAASFIPREKPHQI